MPRESKVVGQPCPDCNTPYVEGKNGEGYCKPCYINWKNNQEDKQPQPVRNDVDWDKIARGKVKHAFAVEAFKMKMSLDKETMARIEKWTSFVMGKPANLVAPEVPTINVEQPAPPATPSGEDDINVENIPF